MRPIRVLVADDEPVIRSALADLISAHPELELVGTAADAEEAIEESRRLAPDVVLLDVRMPRGGGPRAAAEIDALPGSPTTVAFSAYDDRSAILSMLDAGSSGYLVKGAPNTDIIGTLLDASRLRGPHHRRLAVAAQAATTVLVADVPGPACDALTLLVEQSEEFELAGVAGNAAEALRLSCIHRPDAVLIGRALPGDSTVALTEIRQAVPEAGLLVFTGEAEPSGVREAVEAGAMSYLVSGERDEAIREALREAARGNSTFSRAAATAVVRELSVAPYRTREYRRRSRRRDRLERFVRGEGVTVVLQPIFSLPTGAPVAVEALARFDGSPAAGPSVWFAEAAREGMGQALELAAVDAALDALALVPPHVCMSLNVSPSVAATGGFADRVAAAPAHRLIVELTEHAAVEDYGLLAAALEALRGAGLRVAVDDAGAGFASLRHVLLVEPDFVKLDISLCSGVATDRRRRALARALLAFAQETEIATVAEGIERPEDLSALTQLGVDWAQGFHLAPPAPAGELTLVGALG
jgi:EAL domain-containing protein (putative c-di-GMP-specific phosphodiesterase class I)/AmiR/NasT family two-component response regulator